MKYLFYQPKVKNIFGSICFALLLSLLFFTPFIDVAKYVFPAVTGKTVFFMGGCLLLYVFFALYALCYSKIKVSKQDIVLLCVFVFVTINRYIIQADYSFSLNYLEMLGLGITYLVLRTLSVGDYIKILFAVVLSGAAQAVYGILQLTSVFESNHAIFKLTGSFFNPGPYAGFLTGTLVIGCSLLFFKAETLEDFHEKIHPKVLQGIFRCYLPICVSIIFLAIILTGSRSAWFSILITVFVFMSVKFGLFKTKKVRYVILPIVFVASFAALFGLYHLNSDSANGRLFIWKTATGIIKDNPVFGVGFDNFKAHYMNYQARYFSTNEESSEVMIADDVRYAFNSWIELTTENGTTGLALILLLLYTMYKTHVNGRFRYLYVVAMCGLLGIGTFACFSYPMHILPIKLLVIILTGLIANLDARRYVFSLKDNKKMLMFVKCIILMGMLKISFGIDYLVDLDRNFTKWRMALNKSKYAAHNEALALYRSAYPFLANNGEFLQDYGTVLLIMAEFPEESLDVLLTAEKKLSAPSVQIALGDSYKELKKHKCAEKAYKTASNMVPNRFYPEYLLAKLYSETGQKEKAKTMAEKIIAKPVKVNSLKIEEIKQEMREINR